MIPPLRQRRGEIEGLAKKFVQESSERAERADVPTISEDAMGWLKSYHWPGNIRELQNHMERAVLLCTGPEILKEHLPTSTSAPAPAAGAGGDADDNPERQRIIEALEKCAGNQTRAAKLLGISRNTLLARLDAYGIPRPRKPVK